MTDSSTPAVVLTTTHPRAQCVDLRATFGKQFRYAWDPAYDAERSDFRTIEALWLTRIPCRAGAFIYPHGGRRLAAYATQQRVALAALPMVMVYQGGRVGDRLLCPEVVVTFDVADIESVAQLLGARRPRRLSPAARERLRAWAARQNRVAHV